VFAMTSFMLEKRAGDDPRIETGRRTRGVRGARHQSCGPATASGGRGRYDAPAAPMDPRARPCALSAVSVKLCPVISLRELIGEGGNKGAREQFERLIAQLVRLQFLSVERVDANPGDWG
jgi:hypothetical protein